MDGTSGLNQSSFSIDRPVYIDFISHQDFTRNFLLIKNLKWLMLLGLFCLDFWINVVRKAKIFQNTPKLTVVLITTQSIENGLLTIYTAIYILALVFQHSIV